MLGRWERVKSPVAQVKLHKAIFAWPCFFERPSRALVVLTWRGEGCHCDKL